MRNLLIGSAVLLLVFLWFNQGQAENLAMPKMQAAQDRARAYLDRVQKMFKHDPPTQPGIEKIQQQALLKYQQCVAGERSNRASIDMADALCRHYLEPINNIRAQNGML